jgi:hypothetical protein
MTSEPDKTHADKFPDMTRDPEACEEAAAFKEEVRRVATVPKPEASRDE